jgi:uncharacterized protein
VSAVSNSGPIIHLSWIGRLNLLRTFFGNVVVPIAVRDEVLRAGPHVPGMTDIREAFAVGWLSVQIRPPSSSARIHERLMPS